MSNIEYLEEVIEESLRQWFDFEEDRKDCKVEDFAEFVIEIARDKLVEYDINTPENLYNHLGEDGIKVDDVKLKKCRKLKFIVDINGNYNILDFNDFELTNDKVLQTRLEKLSFISSIEIVVYKEVLQDETTYDVLNKISTFFKEMSSQLKFMLNELPKDNIEERMFLLEEYLRKKFNINE